MTPTDSGGPSGHYVDADATLDGGGEDDAAACAYPTMCPQTRGVGPLAGLSGDTTPAGGNSVTTTGSTSEWITVRVTENDTSVVGHAESITAVLASAPGAVFEIYLYKNDGSALAECTTVAKQSNDPSGMQLAQISWGEGATGNDSDDSATVTIRVQHLSGPCGGAAWTLTLTGNTPP